MLGGGDGQLALELADQTEMNIYVLDADAGILFLENVMDMPARAQARLVRVLREVEQQRRQDEIENHVVGEVHPEIGPRRRQDRADEHKSDRIGQAQIEQMVEVLAHGSGGPTQSSDGCVYQTLSG